MIAGATVALALVIGAAGASAAPSAGPEVYVLTSQDDGVVRAAHALFDGSILVPRTSAHDRFAVRNGSGGIAYLRVALTSVDVPDDDLRRSLSLRVSTAAGAGPLVPLDPPGRCLPLLAPQELRPDATVDVDAALALGDLTGTSGQAEPIGFSLLVILDADPAGAGCDAVPPHTAAPPQPAGRPASAPLAATGTDLQAALRLAALLCATGAAALASRRHGARRGSRRQVSRDEE